MLSSPRGSRGNSDLLRAREAVLDVEAPAAGLAIFGTIIEAHLDGDCEVDVRAMELASFTRLTRLVNDGSGGFTVGKTTTGIGNVSRIAAADSTAVARRPAPNTR